MQRQPTAPEVNMLVATIPYPRIDPDVLRLGSLHVRWYGIAYLLGFVLALAALRLMSRKGILRLPAEAAGGLVSWLAMGVVLGGRLGWWMFYHRAQGAVEPWYEPLAIWHGGMSFHGGLAGVLVALLAWSWRQRAPFWNLADCLALVAPLGLFFGRIANFINAELVGRPTALPWGIVFPGDNVARHPSQLYEAILEGPLLLALLWLFRRRCRVPEGRTAAMFLILYGILRFAVEFTRQPDLQLGFIAFGWLSMGQLLSAVLVATGLVVWVSRRGQPASGSAGRAAPAVAHSPCSKEFAHDGQDHRILAGGGGVGGPNGMQQPQGRRGFHAHETR
jgi:phosphatidylglycerol:prolipoprotein diacylglycerol transferase